MDALPSVLPSASTPLAARSAAVPEAPDALLLRERSLIETARSAAARRDAAAALDAVGQHARQFPHGQLVEEREALAVQALVLAGRDADARARAAAFRRRFPRGIYLPVVEAAISGGR